MKVLDSVELHVEKEIAPCEGVTEEVIEMVIS